MRQIFRDQEYNFLSWPQGAALRAYHRDVCATRPGLIVDAGANIGASCVYFLQLFPGSFVYAIEPEAGNWALLERNTQDDPNVFRLLGALAARDGVMYLHDPGSSDWGFRTQAQAPAGQRATPVPAVCPRSILHDPRVAPTVPLIFKIDIEGAEQEVFQGDTAWMDEFPLLVIELHDWMRPFSGSSTAFLRAAVSHDFDVLTRGENLFFFNRRLLTPYHRR